MTKSKMAQYAKGWKHPDHRAEEKRESGMAKAMKGVTLGPDKPGKTKKGC